MNDSDTVSLGDDRPTPGKYERFYDLHNSQRTRSHRLSDESEFPNAKIGSVIDMAKTGFFLDNSGRDY